MSQFIRFYWGNKHLTDGYLSDFLEGHPVCVLELYKALKKVYGGSLVYEIHFLSESHEVTYDGENAYIDSDSISVKKLRELAKKQTKEIEQVIEGSLVVVNSGKRKCRNKKSRRRKK